MGSPRPYPPSKLKMNIFKKSSDVYEYIKTFRHQEILPINNGHVVKLYFDTGKNSSEVGRILNKNYDIKSSAGMAKSAKLINKLKSLIKHIHCKNQSVKVIEFLTSTAFQKPSNPIQTTASVAGDIIPLPECPSTIPQPQCLEHTSEQNASTSRPTPTRSSEIQFLNLYDDQKDIKSSGEEWDPGSASYISKDPSASVGYIKPECADTISFTSQDDTSTSRPTRPGIIIDVDILNHQIQEHLICRHCHSRVNLRLVQDNPQGLGSTTKIECDNPQCDIASQ